MRLCLNCCYGCHGGMLPPHFSLGSCYYNNATVTVPLYPYVVLKASCWTRSRSMLPDWMNPSQMKVTVMHNLGGRIQADLTLILHTASADSMR